MGTFHIAEFVSSSKKLTADELDSKVMSGNLSLGSTGFGYATNGAGGQLAGGWRSIWINTQGMGNHGSLVIVPGDDRTSKLYGYALEKIGRNAGLDAGMASKWASSTVKYKHELLLNLVEVLEDNAESLAYLNYPGYGPGTNRQEWMNNWNITDRGLTAPRQKSLALLVKECVGDSDSLNLGFTVRSGVEKSLRI